MDDERVPASHGGTGEADSMLVERPAAGWIELTAPSREEYLQRIGVLLSKLAGAHLTEEEREDVHLAVTEVVSNAMEWGNGGDANRRVHVSYGLFDNEIVFKVQDEGHGFDPTAMQSAVAQPFEAMRERQRSGKRLGGFGIFVAKKLMDRMLFSERGNVVLLVKRLARSDREAAHGRG
jgi:anti-sigma regulatory factor (Ser/Thr protein kinase)